MKTLSNILKSGRTNAQINLEAASTALKIDKAVISKIENGKRQATKKQVLAFVDLYKLDEQEVLTAWLSDKILHTIQDEDFSLQALMVAEDIVRYNTKVDESDFDKKLQSLLDELDVMQKEWSALKPLEGVHLEKLKEYYNVQYTYESNRIEGNTLTMQETFLVVKEGLTINGKSMVEHLEAINHYEAIDFIADLVKTNEMFTERTLKEIHYLILKSIDKSNAGSYRKVPVYISGSSHIPPQPFLLSKQMEEVFEFYVNHKNKLHPVIMAAEMHERIVRVHPFIDGNGRTSRLAMNLVLLMNGFTIANIKGDEASRRAYYDALESARKDASKEKFYLLVANAVKESLKTHIHAVKPQL